MQPVAVRILHPAPSPGTATGSLERALLAARRDNAERLAALFERAGATGAAIEAGGPDGWTFGHRLRGLAAGLPAGGGLVILGSGAIPLAGVGAARAFVAVAASGERRALANNRYSADVLAVGAVGTLAAVPDLPTDNAVPRWLEEEAGYRVDDLGRRWRLGVDLDSPLDVLLAGLPVGLPVEDLAVARDRIERLRAVAGDRRAEILVAGRTSAAMLRWLERRTASRTRALVEERGLRSRALADGASVFELPRPPRSVLGTVLDDRGPEALGAVLAGLAEGAVVDSRVLLAHRLGAGEAGWPSPEDRFASDLLLAERIADPWLRALTRSARDAAVPVLLGGHTLVGPGLRLVFGRRRGGAGSGSRLESGAAP